VARFKEKIECCKNELANGTCNILSSIAEGPDMAVFNIFSNFQKDATFVSLLPLYYLIGCRNVLQNEGLLSDWCYRNKKCYDFFTEIFEGSNEIGQICKNTHNVFLTIFWDSAINRGIVSPLILFLNFLVLELIISNRYMKGYISVAKFYKFILKIGKSQFSFKHEKMLIWAKLGVK